MLKSRRGSFTLGISGLIFVLAACTEEAPDKPKIDAAVKDAVSGGDLKQNTNLEGGAGEGILPDNGVPAPPQRCPALPAPDPQQGKITRVDSSQVGSLSALVSAAEPGETFLFADGHYELKGEYLWIKAAGVTLRSESGDRGAVILNGNYQTTEIITVAASDVTVADLTIREAYTHGIHVVATAEDPAHRAKIYNVQVIDSREQAIKINVNAPDRYPDQGLVACSRLELTDVGRPQVNPTSGGCYTGGVDAHQAQDWVVRDNVITGFWCATGLAEHAVHFWRGGRGTIVERNRLVNNARGVGFGLGSSGDARSYSDQPCAALGAAYIGHYEGVIRNNFIFVDDPGLLGSASGFDCGVCLWSACNAQVLHNTIVATGSNFSSVEWRFAGSQGIEISNNLTTHPMQAREDAQAHKITNLEGAALTLFKDGAGGELHLAADAAEAIDHGTALAAGLCSEDFDGDLRDSTPDIGADEVR